MQCIYTYIGLMNIQKIKTACLHTAMPVLLFFSAVILPSACNKQQAVKPVTDPVPAPTNNQPMPDSSVKRYLALGDSYTIGTSVTEADRYPVQTVALLKTQGIAMANAEIIATNGWTTADLIAATRDKPASNDYDVVSLLIGVNNQYRAGSIDEYRRQFNILLQRAIQLAGGRPSRVIVLSIPDYSVTPFASGSDKQKIAREIDAFNEVNKTLSSDSKVTYLYITDESRKAAADPSLLAFDGLHFSGKAYAVWSASLAAMIKTALQ
jgi:lysophospholipase L1-like esterase